MFFGLYFSLALAVINVHEEVLQKVAIGLTLTVLVFILTCKYWSECSPGVFCFLAGIDYYLHCCYLEVPQVPDQGWTGAILDKLIEEFL